MLYRFFFFTMVVGLGAVFSLFVVETAGADASAEPGLAPNAQHHSAHNGIAVLAPTGDVPRGPDGVPLDGWAHRVALVIGNNAYQKDGMELKNPVNDANDVAELLREGGFEVIRGLNLDRATMTRVIRQFREKLDTRGRAVFYFAGHALEIEGENYLLPTDIANMRFQVDAKSDGIALASVFAQIASQPSGAHLIVLDACRDNPLPMSSGTTRRTEAELAPLRINQRALPNATIIGYAVPSGGEAPDEGFNGRNSLYTETFLQVARKHGHDTRVDNLLGGVNSQLMQLTDFSGETITYNLPIDLKFNLLPSPPASQPVVFNFREVPAPGTRVFINGEEVNYDGQGRFEMASLWGKDNVRLRVEREGYEIIQDSGFNFDPAHPIALPPMAPMASMPQPIGSFMLEVENAPQGTTVRAAGNLIPDFRGSGQYLFDKLEGEYIDYEVTAPGYGPISARKQLESGRENSERVSLAPNRGVYLLQGVTPATATVEVLGADEIRVVRGTAPGEWQLENVPTGNLRVKIDAEHHHVKELEVPVVMLEAGGASRLSHPEQIALARLDSAEPGLAPNTPHDTAHNGIAVLSPTGDVPRGADGEPLDGWKHRVALVIGNNAYQKYGMELKKPVNDAYDVAELLREGGFEVMRGLNLDRATMTRVIRQFSEKLDPRGRAIFYFAGHALEIDGENYLLPIDIAAMRFQMDAKTDGVALHYLFQQIATQPSGAHLIVLDACRVNPLPMSSGSRRTEAQITRLNVVVQTLPENTVLGFTVPSGGEAPDEGFNGRNSLYTETFLQVARKHGHDTRVDMLLGGVHSQLMQRTSFSGEVVVGDLPIDLEFNLLPPLASTGEAPARTRSESLRNRLGSGGAGSTRF